MSFTLKSIELRNIRAHEYFLFEPALEGITAISGDNGAGKSTVVDAFAWSLYGTRPSGVKNRNLIKDGIDPKDKTVSVKAIIIVGGIEYVIERKIINTQGTVECNVWGKHPGKKEFTQVAGPSVSHVEKFIKNELGMNEKGFLTSVFIQQKQVDQIVSATPKERGVVIEELTGISSITQAISKTNENTRSLEKAISIFQVGNIEGVEEKVSKQEQICREIEEKQRLAVEKFNVMKEIYKKSKEDLDIQQVKVNKRIKLTQTIENLKDQVDFLKKQAENDLNYIVEFKNKYGTTVYTDTNKSKKNVEEKRNESYNIKSQISNLKADLDKISEDIKKCVILKGNFQNEKDAIEELKVLGEKLKNATGSLEKLKDKKSMLISELKHSEASHKHINGEDKNCPVCKSNIKDPEKLKTQIENEIESYKKEQKENDADIKKLTSEIINLEESIKYANVSIEANKEENRLNTTKEKLNRKLKELSNESALVDSDLKMLEIEYDKALRVEADKRALDSAKERSLTVNAKIDSNQNQIKGAEEEITKLDALSDRSLNALIKKVDEAQERLTKMSIAGKELMGRKKLELERLEDNKKNLKQVQDAIKRYNEIANQIEVSTSASAMLAAFKSHRIEHAIPTLEFYASDFLSKFTGGDFTKLSIDEKFNTFVTTSKGNVRPVAQLSGGELSSAAIALRLGISMLLNSSENNVLILDEVLVSMDEDRSRQIMETIGSMTSSQIIFIAHNSDINSIADKTVLVSKNNK